MTASGLRFFWMLIAAGALLVALTLGDLPASVATNFGGGGVPHAWMSRQVYAGYLAIIGVVLPLLTVAVASGRGGTQSAQWWLGSLVVGFALGVPRPDPWGSSRAAAATIDVGVPGGAGALRGGLGDLDRPLAQVGSPPRLSPSPH
jgi:hypothetical protein